MEPREDENKVKGMKKRWQGVKRTRGGKEDPKSRVCLLAIINSEQQRRTKYISLSLNEGSSVWSLPLD